LALGGPGLGFQEGLLIAWTGTDSAHHLNVARLQGSWCRRCRARPASLAWATCRSSSGTPFPPVSCHNRRPRLRRCQLRLERRIYALPYSGDLSGSCTNFVWVVVV